MPPSEALSTAAQIAVALGGFAGIIVAFRTGSVHEWEAVDKFRLRLLLSNSLIPLTCALFAMLLLSIEPAPTWTWRAGSALSLALTIPFAASTNKGARGFAQYQSGTTRAIFYLFATLGTTALVLQAINVIFLNAFWPFSAGIFVHLVAAAFQFVRMILSTENRPNE